MKTLCYGAKKQFVDRFSPKEFLAANRLVDTLIAADILCMLKR